MKSASSRATHLRVQRLPYLVVAEGVCSFPVLPDQTGSARLDQALLHGLDILLDDSGERRGLEGASNDGCYAQLVHHLR